ncbi:MAG: hypothetical protein ACOYJR_04825 [Acutalibacteraceae bacterium]|jgi:hypothetical protein
MPQKNIGLTSRAFSGYRRRKLCLRCVNGKSAENPGAKQQCESYLMYIRRKMHIFALNIRERCGRIKTDLHLHNRMTGGLPFRHAPSALWMCGGFVFYPAGGSSGFSSKWKGMVD